MTAVSALALLASPALAAALSARPLPAAAPAALAAAAAPSMPLFPLLPSAAAPAPLSAPAPAPTLLPPGLSERRGVGLLAIDFKGSTPLHASAGNRRARALVAAALDYSEAAGASFDGAVVRRLGDGHVLAFPTAGQALAAALAIQSGLEEWRQRVGAPPVELHAGVHAGRVLVESDGARVEVFGQAVERALELAALSRGGDVAVETGLASHPAARAAAASAEEVAGAALLRPRPGPAGAEPPGLQRPLTVSRFERAATLFADLAGWPAAYEAHGRRRSYETVAAFRRHARAVVERHGGVLVKAEGETVMASFPRAADSLRAAAELRAGLDAALRDAPLGAIARVRVGVSFGRVLREDRLDGFDFFGNTVNAAARLMRLAAPGEVLASSALLAEPGSEALLSGAERRRTRLKGFADEQTVLRLPD